MPLNWLHDITHLSHNRIKKKNNDYSTCLYKIFKTNKTEYLLDKVTEFLIGSAHLCKKCNIIKKHEALTYYY